MSAGVCVMGQWPWHNVIWRPRFRPARFQHAMLAPLRWSPRWSPPRKTRRARRRMRPTHVRDEHIGIEFPTLTIQDIPDLAGAIVYDCRPPLLPVSLRLKDIGLLPRSRPVASASLAAPPPENDTLLTVNAKCCTLSWFLH